MKNLFLNALIPCMRAKRAQTDRDHGDQKAMYSSGGRQRPMGSDDHPEPMLLMLDGEHAQLRALTTTVLNDIKDDFIEVNKLPGGGSLQYQPNDLMRSHCQIHKLTTSNAFKKEEAKGYHNPAHLNAVSDILKKHKIEKASYNCFCNFMKQLPIILSDAFTTKTILQGWALSGVQPYSPIKIMEQCASWSKLQGDEQQKILDVIPQLASDAATSGIVRDEDIHRHLGHIISTEITDMANRPLNQQRSLWLNGEIVQEMRMKADQEKAAQKAAAEARAKKREDDARRKTNSCKILRALESGAVKKRSYDEIDVPIPPQGILCHAWCQASYTGIVLPKKRKLMPADTEKWTGCPWCHMICCGKANCQKTLTKHMQICGQGKLVTNDDIAEDPALMETDADSDEELNDD
jgi:hypothetical protein